MAGRLKKYAYINAKLRARISRLVDGNTIERLMRAPSLAEAIVLLRDTSYGFLEATFSRTGDLKMVELELFQNEIDDYTGLLRFLEPSILEVIRALMQRFEIDVIKTAVRLWFDRTVRDRDIKAVVGYVCRRKIIYDLRLDAIINAESVREVFDGLGGTPYAAILQESADIIETRQSLFDFEIGLDHFYYRRLEDALRYLDSKDREVARKLVGVQIDLQNVDWLVRLKVAYGMPADEALRYIVPQGFFADTEAARRFYSSSDLGRALTDLLGSRYSSVSTFLKVDVVKSLSQLVFVERLLEQIVDREVRRTLAGYPFTVGIILAYSILKRNETRRVMAVLNAKQYNLGQDRIESVI